MGIYTHPFPSLHTVDLGSPLEEGAPGLSHHDTWRLPRLFLEAHAGLVLGRSLEIMAPNFPILQREA